MQAALVGSHQAKCSSFTRVFPIPLRTLNQMGAGDEQASNPEQQRVQAEHNYTQSSQPHLITCPQGEAGTETGDHP